MTEPGYHTIFQDLAPLRGFHEMEADTWGPFVWSERRFALRKPLTGAYYVARLCFNDDEAVLYVTANGAVRKEISIQRGWNNYPLDFSYLGEEDIHFELSHIPPVPGDSRELGLMVRRIRPVENRQVFGMVTDAWENKKLNDREFTEGRIHLNSFPQHLRIGMERRCNMDPHCVYCREWERTKTDEKTSVFVATHQKLIEMGKFYILAEHIGETGCGEPLLNSDFAAIVQDFHRCGKPFALTTNGQLLNDSNRSTILGKDLEFYVSLDSATAEGYRRYRNDKFDLLINNLRALCNERQAHNRFPNVIASFIAMRSNIDEFPMFVDLMKDVGVDGIRISTLHGYPRLRSRVEHRPGFDFRYGEEAFSLNEFLRFLEDAKVIAAAKQMPVLACTDFNGEDAHVNGPLCNEPWKTINASIRGLAICSQNTGGIIAKWWEQGPRTLEQFMADVWNGEKYQEIRSQLAQGRLARPCIEARNCNFARRILESDSESGRSGSF